MTSPAFWIVLALAVPLHWALPRRFRDGFLVLVSGGFLLSVDHVSVLALGAWIGVVYAASPVVARPGPGRRPVMLAFILGTLGFLAYFKYLPPLIEGLVPGQLERAVLLPVGISYYTFKLIHYLVEVSRGGLRERSLASFACYMFLLPTFSAGPIQRYDRFLADRDEHFRQGALVEGLTRVVHGLIKRFVLASFIGARLYGGRLRADTLPELLPELSVLEAWAYVIATYVYVYLDFSAYSDLAIGCSRLFGIRVMENFRFPVVADTIREYWRRWHMTLSGWCQSYVYMPVLGLYRQPLLSLYLTFLVMGLWHEGSWNRVGWGMYHATGVALYTAWARYRKRRGWSIFDGRLGRAWGLALTQLFVSGSMCFLILDEDYGLSGSLALLAKLTGLDPAALPES